MIAILTQKRYELILKLLEEKKSITITDLKQILNISESTARRDVTNLDKMGKLTKVFGGAIAVEKSYNTAEQSVAQKMDLNKEEKIKIAKKAATLIKPGDFIYIDAGTTTWYMIDFIENTNISVVTNAVVHAQKLAQIGCNKVILLGGELKTPTEAVIGSLAMQSLSHYNFTKGFFGTNGITKDEGYTTPDLSEAAIKRTAISQCNKKYILADSSKFDQISSVTFYRLEGTTIISDTVPKGFESFVIKAD